MHISTCTGEAEKKVSQKAWVSKDNKNNSNWNIQPIWPLSLDYVILEVCHYYQGLIKDDSKDYPRAILLTHHPILD